MKYIKTFESYNKSGKDDEIVEEVLELISLRNDKSNIEHFVKRGFSRDDGKFSDRNFDTTDYLGYTYASNTHIFIKKVITTSKLVDINNNAYTNSHFEIVNYDYNDYNYILDINEELSKKLYNELLRIKSMYKNDNYMKNTNKTKRLLKSYIDDEVKNNMSDIGIM